MTSKQVEHSHSLFPIKGFITVTLLKFIHWLPDGLTLATGRFLGRRVFQFSAKRRNTMMTNLAIAYPEMTEQQHKELAEKASEMSGQLISEFAKAWLADKQQIVEQIDSVSNAQLIEENSKDNQPVIIVTPHIGNWEIFVQWVQINYPMFGLYSRSRIPQLDQLILQARSKFGCTPFPADNRGVLNLLRKLKKGGIMVMLPDQVPQKGAGTYSDFYGKPAYTMTLLHKMIQRTGAKLLFAHCVRGENGFIIEIEDPKFDGLTGDVEQFNRQLNRQIELIINRFPEQYIWDYKRFKSQQDGKSFYKNN